eukprot:TRINITY_DN3746_c1_g1_i1.p1 TRINITY_DN3746_c1_g1~~TRINITY_DN3746_c1_g1_i1.p1  ORF type:complete len:255 (+),score=37.39 TRINITY_DN3746_c1_g1_i1:34-798(+)
MSLPVSPTSTSSPTLPAGINTTIDKVFSQLESLLKDASNNEGEVAENRQLLVREFANYFGVHFENEKGETQSTGTQRLGWMPETAADWSLTNNNCTATMSACGGWRSLVADTPVDSEVSFFNISIHALRTLAIGITCSDSSPQYYVGDDSGSWGYQSTGHMLSDGEIVGGENLAPTFQKGDVIGVLVDRRQRYIAFYKNNHMAGVPFTGIDVDGKSLRLVISCYMGPCSVSINMSPLSTSNLMTFPICIDQKEN